MHDTVYPGGGDRVALRKESVDRNKQNRDELARYIVALRKESVDRNKSGHVGMIQRHSRSPQGERG